MDVISRVKLKDNSSFKLKMLDNHFSKNDIINMGTLELKVVKVRKFNWWRKLLLQFGIEFISCDLKQI